MSLYSDIVAAGIETDNHQSDLYIPRTVAALEILAKYPEYRYTAKTFVNNLDGKLWIDVPFAYLPWWEKRAQ